MADDLEEKTSALTQEINTKLVKALAEAGYSEPNEIKPNTYSFIIQYRPIIESISKELGVNHQYWETPKFRATKEIIDIAKYIAGKIDEQDQEAHEEARGFYDNFGTP